MLLKTEWVGVGTILVAVLMGLVVCAVSGHSYPQQYPLSVIIIPVYFTGGTSYYDVLLFIGRIQTERQQRVESGRRSPFGQRLPPTTHRLGVDFLNTRALDYKYEYVQMKSPIRIRTVLCIPGIPVCTYVAHTSYLFTGETC